ncbi:hypothetical protein [Chromobacterium haemolyticum]|uniref:hypothetical protein n=1 Tax=Chromobacterium haemolyticum TaxID=394935 RepID=UPI002446C51E|nr:hypothetical protein [Chromobacterium haemolyticum]MDH0342151.1 hypothetical protein [Chromobacterium haemolyticum]
MSSSTSLENKANGIFAEFCDRLAKVDLRMAVAVPATIGVIAAMYGIGLEVHGQGELLRHGGLMAVDAYKSAMQAAPIDSATEYVKLAFAGKLPSFGGNEQGIGIGVMALGPALTSASVLLARGFDKVKAFLGEKLEQAKEMRAESRPSHHELSARLTHGLGGGSMVLKGIEATKSSRPGFYVEGREKGEAQNLDDAPALRARPR